MRKIKVDGYKRTEKSGETTIVPSHERVLTTSKTTTTMGAVSIRMPTELRDKLRKNAKSEGVPMWKYIESLL